METFCKYHHGPFPQYLPLRLPFGGLPHPSKLTLRCVFQQALPCTDVRGGQRELQGLFFLETGWSASRQVCSPFPTSPAPVALARPVQSHPGFSAHPCCPRGQPLAHTPGELWPGITVIFKASTREGQPVSVTAADSLFQLPGYYSHSGSPYSAVPTLGASCPNEPDCKEPKHHRVLAWEV